MNPEPASSAVVVVDVQERFVPAVKGLEPLLPKLKTLLAGAKELSVQVLATEQYPKGLGRTLPDVAALLPLAPFEKTSFSCFGCEPFRSALTQFPLKTLAICGVESHVCVLQTALDALERGYEVYVLADCVASRSEADKALALDFLAKAGAKVVGVEIFLFLLLKDAGHPAFKAISKLVK